MRSLAFFISKSIPERQIIEFFKEEYKLQLDSLNHRNITAEAFLHYNEEDGDIKAYIHLILPKGLVFIEEPSVIAEKLAIFYQTDVLVEQEIPCDNREYLMFDSLGNRYRAHIDIVKDKLLTVKNLGSSS